MSKRVTEFMLQDKARRQEENVTLGFPPGVSWDPSPLFDFAFDPTLAGLPDFVREISVAWMCSVYTGLLEEGKDIKILEAGAGFGEVCHLVKCMRKGKGTRLRYVCMDIDERKRDRFMIMDLNREYRIGDFKDFDEVVPELSFFDAVVSTEVLEHMEKNQGIVYLDHLLKRLAVGGVLILTTPNREQYQKLAPYHVYEWDHDELRAHLETLNIEILDDFYMKGKIRALPHQEEVEVLRKRVPPELLRGVLMNGTQGAVSAFVVMKTGEKAESAPFSGGKFKIGPKKSS